MQVDPSENQLECIRAIKSKNLHNFLKFVKQAPDFNKACKFYLDRGRILPYYYAIVMLDGYTPSEEFLTYISWRKYFDIDVRIPGWPSSMEAAVRSGHLEHARSLILSGANIHTEFESKNLIELSKASSKQFILGLLWVGVDPKNNEMPDFVKYNVRKMIQSLSLAKKLLKKWIKNSYLENLTIEFVHTEKFLIKVL